MKRFFKTAKVAAHGNSYTVELDGKAIKTPAGQPLAVPTQPLAVLIAEEWQNTGDTIDAALLLHTQLANSAIDRGEGERDKLLQEIGNYVEGDCLLYRSDEPEVARRQLDAWEPWLDWCEDAYGVRPVVTDGIMPISQLESTGAALVTPFDALSAHQLAPARLIVTGLSSVILSLAVLQGALDIEKAWALSILEITVQEERWGTDPEAEAARTARQREVIRADAHFRAASMS